MEERLKQEDQGRGQYENFTVEHQKFDCKWICNIIKSIMDDI